MGGCEADRWTRNVQIGSARRNKNSQPDSVRRALNRIRPMRKIRGEIREAIQCLHRDTPPYLASALSIAKKPGAVGTDHGRF